MLKTKVLSSFKSKIIYRSKIDEGICKEASEYAKTHKDKFLEKSWECKIKTSLSVTNNILNVVNLHRLKMNILSHIDNFMNQNNSFFDGYLKTSWINIYEKDFYQDYHIHNNTVDNFISGVVYLSENNSDIVLASKEDLVDTIKHTPSFRDIILFFGDTPHMVEPNTNDSLRISLAFNFKLVEKWSKP